MIIHSDEKKDDVEYNNLEENDEADIECYDLIWERIVFYNNDNWRGYMMFREKPELSHYFFDNTNL